MAIHKDKFQDYMRLCFCQELSFLCSRAGNCWCLRQKSCLSHFAPSWTSNLQTRWAQNWELWAATGFTEGVNINFECNYFQYIHAVFYDIYVTQEIILESWFLIFGFCCMSCMMGKQSEFYASNEQQLVGFARFDVSKVGLPEHSWRRVSSADAQNSAWICTVFQTVMRVMHIYELSLM